MNGLSTLAESWPLRVILRWLRPATCRHNVPVTERCEACIAFVESASRLLERKP